MAHGRGGFLAAFRKVSAGSQASGAVSLALAAACAQPAPATSATSAIEGASADRLRLFGDGTVLERRGAEAQIYPRSALGWKVDYELVLPPGLEGAGGCSADPRPAPVRLNGRLSLSNRTGAPLDEVEVILEEGSVQARRAEVRAGAFRLPAPISIERGGAATVALFAGGAREISGVPVELYDPVGAGRDRATKKPIRRARYGATSRGEVELHVELDLDSAGIRQALPAGEVKVFSRDGGGELKVLGETTAFGRPRAAPARVRIGTARGLRARRWQEDYAYDERGRRLLEEIRIELDSRCDAGAEVILREHLYRGLNWALAYYNDAGPLEKTGRQEIEMRVALAPGEKALAVYRVVYTW